jgi:hypothetical protein
MVGRGHRTGSIARLTELGDAIDAKPALPPPPATRVVLVATIHAAGTSAVGQV